MSGTPYNSVLRSGLTRRLWLIIFVAMLIPVGIALMAHWFEAEERRATLQNQELIALSRDKASTLLFSNRVLPADFARGLEGRYLVVLDGAGSARFSNTPVPDELVQLFARRSPHAIDAPSGTTILAWYASGREWRTTPLWGLRLMRRFLDGHALLMHDGRARSVEEAILLHGGERVA